MEDIPRAVAAASEAGNGGDGGLLWLLIAVAAFLYALAYAISIRLHPYKNCRPCRGSGKHRGLMFTRAFRPCGYCGGKGRQLRRFAKEP